MLSIIIVSWNTLVPLRRCLQTVEANKGTHALEIIVVDNNSSDGTPAMLREEFPGVRLIEAGANLGFSAGNNLGLRAARGEWLLLLNPDTEVVSDALQQLVGTLETNPYAGAAGPRVRYGDGSEQITRHRFPALWTLATASTPVAPLFASLLDRFYYQRNTVSDPVFTDWLTGAAILVRRSVVDQVGGFDERYFMYFEETDWQRRIKSAGWTILYDPAAQIVHHEAQASRQVSGQRDRIFNRSRLRYARRWHGPLASRLLRFWLLVLYTFEGFKEGVKWLLGHKRALRRERLTHYFALVSFLALEA